VIRAYKGSTFTVDLMDADTRYQRRTVDIPAENQTIRQALLNSSIFRLAAIPVSSVRMRRTGKSNKPSKGRRRSHAATILSNRKASWGGCVCPPSQLIMSHAMILGVVDLQTSILSNLHDA